MSKCVLLSVRPRWCKLIASGKKTIEVRKTRPKLETPFKCYIYRCLEKSGDIYTTSGKVIGEFVCDFIVPMFKDSGGIYSGRVELACLSGSDIHRYANGKQLFGWHISELVIYDKPRELSEFHKPTMPTGLRYEDDAIKRPPESWCYVEEYDGKR